VSFVSRPRPSVARLSVTTAAAALVALAACTPPTLDMDAVKKAISEGVDAQLSLPIESVSCPPPRPVKAGDSFECIATPRGGGRLTVTVTQDDAKSKVSWKVAKTEGLLDLQKVEASIVAGLREQAKVEATAACGGRWKAAKAGDSFECEAKASGGQTATIVVSVADGNGNISWKTK
jgi:hypothetical protein